MNAPFFTRQGAENWLATNRTPQPAQLQAFLAADPRPLPAIPAPGLSTGLLKVTLTLLGALALGVVGWLSH